jgi:hypothetical protein
LKKWLRKPKNWRINRRHKQFLVIEARRYMEELGMLKPGESDQAVLAITVGIGVGTLGGMALSHRMKNGTVLHAVLESLPAQRLDG